jgi:PAS domain S-box-containing protein
MPKMDPLQILIVEDDENDVILLQKELRAGGLVFDSRVVDTHSDFVRALDETIPDLIIADFQLPRFDALSALELSQHKTRRTPFIIFTGCLDESTAVLCMKLGAWDYVLKQNPVRLVACIRSALERRRLVEEREQAIREGEQRFRQIADVAPVLIWMADASGSFHYFNRAWLAFTGRSESAEKNSGWIEGIHPADRSRFEQTIQGKIATLQQCQIEFRLRRHDGSYRWILCNGAPYYSGKERFSGYIGSGIDITDLKEAEVARGHGFELTNALIESIPWPAYAKDSSGRFVAVNQAASLLLGRSRDAFNGRTNAQLGLETEFADLEARENEVLQSGAPTNGLNDASSADGRFTISPWGVTKDGIAGIVVMDVSKQSGGLSSKNRHDINNHVAIIRMYSEFLGEQQDLDERFRSKIRQILDTSEKLGALITAISETGESERAKAR